MALALGGPLLLYTLQTLKDNNDTPLDAENQGASPAAPSQPLPSEAVSIPSFVQTVQHPPSQSRPLYVTSIEWKYDLWRRRSYQYVVIYASSSVQAAPTIAIRVDRHGKLGIKVPWWHIRPPYFFANTKRTATSVLARPTGDPTTDPTNGTSIIKYTHWTHALPPSIPISDLKRSLERARNNACTALNHAVRPYITHGLHLSDQQIRHDRRWADSRGLQFVHTDVADAVADVMETSMVSCVMQTLWTKILPRRILWRSLRRNVGVGNEYFRVVQDYQQELLRLISSCPGLDSEARSKVALSWGIDETKKSPSLLLQFLTGSLSNHAFISPHAPAARLSDVASRLESLVPIIPASGPGGKLCKFHSDTLVARLPDKLWHSYAVSPPSVPVSDACRIWCRFADTSTFSFLLDVIIQWFIALLLLPQDGPKGLWVTCTCLYHASWILRWRFQARKIWRKVWKLYEGSMIQSEDELIGDESGSLSSLWSQSKASLLSTKWDNRTFAEIPMVLLN
ncbi:hypothetical protein FRC09_019490 [Ceratobasidium sp. 395]|nr:hypothetical protein FRC09_019490 [Ceratobasidium sp. 395]